MVQYDDAVLRDALHRLERRGYTRLASGAGSRAPKYRHLLAEALPMAEDEQAVMCVLMLRGPQTPGELKQRTERMNAFADLGGVHETLQRLIGRELVAALERRPGQKEERYMQLLEGEETSSGGSGAAVPSQPMAAQVLLSPHQPIHQAGGAASAESPAAVEALEERVARLEREVARLQAALGDRAGEQDEVEEGTGVAEDAEERVEEGMQVAEDAEARWT